MQGERNDRRRRPMIDWHYWPIASLQPCAPSAPEQLDTPSRPEIEDEPLIAWGLAQSKEESKNSKVTVDLLYGEGANLNWDNDVDNQDLERLFKPLEIHSPCRSLRVCFINTLDSARSWLPGNFDIQPDTVRILLRAGLSKAILTNIYSQSGYWAKMGNQRHVCYDTDENLKTFEICYQYRCGWDTGVSFIHFVRTRNQSSYFCINYPDFATQRLKAIVNSNPLLAHRDFLLDALVTDDSLKQWQHEIGTRRDTLQKYERLYQEEGTDFKLATIQLHRVSRHWLTLGQDCADFKAQMEFVRESYVVYRKLLTGSSPPWNIDRSADMRESFDMLISSCDTCMRWTEFYQERTNVSINLLFHLVNQRESRTSTQIATSTAEVARQTQRDSASMITIAAVTMFFLPGTFISAILSTTFFDYGDEGLKVSKKWWVLPALAIPLTAIVFAVWMAWRYMTLRRRMKVPVQFSEEHPDTLMLSPSRRLGWKHRQE
ncbi:hypothetical protein IQ07DRAFT_568360 [Pyrenochaeta sp. DS3sAY3a]|nr:hypothetical protein IQ07DRAFT_568360 [Pyrenochaeta sp. DS3sAY3a]